MRVKKTDRKIALVVIILFNGITNIFCQFSKTIVISNPTSVARPDELITLKKEAIEKQLGIFPEFVAVFHKGKQLTVQYIDVNGDHKWDEAVFLFSFKQNEKAYFTILSDTANTEATAEARAHVRLRKKNADNTFGPALISDTMPLRNPATDFSRQPLPLYLTEGPAWENDKVAFRLYFDVRNNKDIYGKTAPKMMMDTVGIDNKVSYHVLSSWGMDVLHVVKSLGAGALAISVPKAAGEDTIIRLGGGNVKKTVYRQIADGPLLAKFSVTYEWEINSKPVQVSEEISIRAGQYFYESNVTVKGAPERAKLVTGIANFYENTFQTFIEGDAAVALSHGRQSENKDKLGLGILVNKQTFAGVDSINRSNTDVNETYCITQTITNKVPLYYRFYACWERTEPRFATIIGFKNLLHQEAIKYTQPLVLKWINKRQTKTGK